MCLVLIEVEPIGVPDGDGASGPVYVELLDAVQKRLWESLRRYDELTQIGRTSLALVLRTLADATVLAGRMQFLFSRISEPYLFDGEEHEIQVRVALGAAVRIPQESPQEFVGRVGQAMSVASEEGFVGPVIL